MFRILNAYLTTNSAFILILAVTTRDQLPSSLYQPLGLALQPAPYPAKSVLSKLWAASYSKSFNKFQFKKLHLGQGNPH